MILWLMLTLLSEVNVDVLKVKCMLKILKDMVSVVPNVCLVPMLQHLTKLKNA